MKRTVKTAVERFNAGEAIHTMADVQAIKLHMEGLIKSLLFRFEQQAAGCIVHAVAIERLPFEATIAGVELTIEID